MNGFWGANTDDLRSVGSVYVRRAEYLSDLETSLSSLIDVVEWTGDDADAFRAEWTGRVRPGLQAQYAELRHEARQLGQHADEQDAASVPDGLGGISGSGGFRLPIADNLLLRLDLAPGDSGRPDAGRTEPWRALHRRPDGRVEFDGPLPGNLIGALLGDFIDGPAMPDGTGVFAYAPAIGHDLGYAGLDAHRS